ncbi:MAG: 3-phosphoshikimate 1-carboxyvinyltransferase [Rhodospirillaceae bacterium]|nr:3-phosphoshikimate 1-carboxyvinyltransferase [Rhodospirillaceae bacterium]
MFKLRANKSLSLHGEIKVPGDKSISHRSIILGSLAVGETLVNGLLESEDVLHTVQAMGKFGAIIEKIEEQKWSIHGRGVGGLDEPETPLYLGNSGTGVRLLMGVAASHPFNTFFFGDKSLSKRPMRRVSTPLKMMGADFISRAEGSLPLVCIGPRHILPIQYELPVASAQVKSAILIAALGAAGETTIIEPEPTRDHTELMLQQFGAEISTNTVKQSGREVTITGQPELRAQTINVPSDPSSAAFPTVAALISPNSFITIKNVCANPLRFGLFEILLKMGANIDIVYHEQANPEKIADITIQSSRLQGIEICSEIAPRMIDEYPILAVAAAFAEGTTTMQGLKELRVKESDRLSAIADGLTLCGIKVEETIDSLTVYGTGGSVKGGALIETNMDHRIAMAFLVLGIASEQPVEIDDATTIETSFPHFCELMSTVGAKLTKTTGPREVTPL